MAYMPIMTQTSLSIQRSEFWYTVVQVMPILSGYKTDASQSSI